MLIDTHTHLNDEQLYIELDKHINLALDRQVGKMIVIGWDKQSSILALNLAHRYPFIYACVGVHPSNIKDEDENLDWLIELAKDPKVVGIGEIGLDYYWDKDNKEDQREWFKRQIEIAKMIGKPIAVHTRDAIGETYDILKEARYYKGVIHCFSGSLEMAKKFIDLGFYLGIGGVITFKNSNLPSVVSEIGIDRIISETDAPYLSPVPYRGKMNEPKNIYEIVLKISEVCGISFKECEKRIEQNVKDLFNI